MGFLSHFSFLMLGAISLLVSFGFFNFYFPLYAVKFFGETMIGLLITSHFAGYFSGAFQLSRWIGRVGHIRIFAFVTALISSSLLLVPFADDLVSFFIIRFLIGFGHAGVYVVAEGWINARVENTSRGKAFAIYRIVELLCLSVGQFGIIWLDHFENAAVFSILAIMTIISVLPLSMTLERQPDTGVETNFSLMQAFQISPLTAVGMLLTGIVNSCFWSLSPLFIVNSGLPENQIPYIFAFFIGGGVLLMFPIGRWSDFKDRRIFVCACMMVCALAGLLNWFLPMGRVSMAICFFFFGASAMPLYSLLITHGISRSHGLNETAVCSEYLFLFGIGAMIGPTVCGSMMKLIGTQAFALHAFFFYAPGAIFCLYQIQKNPEVPEREKEDFVVVPNTTPSILEVDTENTHLMEDSLGDPESP